MKIRPVLGTTAAVLAGLVLVPPAPAQAHGDGEIGDVATNTRGLEVATSGEGKAMKFVANLQYDDSGDVQNGSDIEFLRLGDREFALAGTLDKGMQIINITNPREPRKVATFDCRISQGDIQVWKRDGRVLASYTADGTVGGRRRGVHLRPRPRPVGRRRRHRSCRPDHSEQAVLAELPRRPPRLAQHDDPPERALPLQLQLRPAHQHRAEHHDLRRDPADASGEGARLPHPVRADLAGLGVARHHLQRQRHPRLLRRPVADADPRHDRPAATRSRSARSSTRPSTSSTRPTR